MQKITSNMLFSVHLVLTVLLFSLISCGNSNQSKLQGNWGVSGAAGDSTEFQAWYINYSFEGREYKKAGYPPITEEGTFEIISENKDSLELYFNVLSSSPETKSYKQWVLLKDCSLFIGDLELKKK